MAVAIIDVKRKRTREISEESVGGEGNGWRRSAAGGLDAVAANKRARPRGRFIFERGPPLASQNFN